MKKIEKLMREDFEKNVQPKFDADFYDRLHAKVEETVEKRKAEKRNPPAGASRPANGELVGRHRARQKGEPQFRSAA